MGIAHNRLYHLMRTTSDFSLTGAVATLGEQTVAFDRGFLEATAAHEGFSLGPSDRAVGQESDGAFSAGMRARTLFRRLGFTDFVSIDISDFEGCTFRFDLNSAGVPQRIKDRFDLVYNGGTLEHVFHVPNALGNVFDMLKIGGAVVHSGPVNGWVEHGFYQFSPTLLLDFYSANRYDILEAHLVELRPAVDSQNDVWRVTSYTPGSLDNVGAAQMGNSPRLLYFTARKTEQSTRDMVPHQRHRGHYAKLYGAHVDVSEAPLLTAYEPYDLCAGVRQPLRIDGGVAPKAALARGHRPPPPSTTSGA